MNHYYAEFHAHDRMEQFHREAYGSQRISQARGRGSDKPTRRVLVRPVVAAVLLFAAILVGLMIALPARAAGALTDRTENVDSVLVVAFADNYYPVSSIMRAELQTDDQSLALH